MDEEKKIEEQTEDVSGEVTEEPETVNFTEQIAELEEKLKKAEAELDKSFGKMKDINTMYVRLQADFDNYKKRTAEQLKNARGEGIADAMMKARAPRAKILMVFNVRNSEAWVEQPTVRPRRITTISFKLLLAVLASRVVFPLSFRRFPKNSIPNNGKPDGTIKVVRSRPMIGKRIFSVCET